MAKSKYEYVKNFEEHYRCLENCWIIVRVDGKNFGKFAEKHNFIKPNDVNALQLMVEAAKSVMLEIRDITVAYGQSDEFSFVFRNKTDLYKRRKYKILSTVTSCFSSNYVFHWSTFMTRELISPPIFDGRVILYPSEQIVRDYLSWRQADAHVNNLYNTCFWNLVKQRKISPKEAALQLEGTLSSDKNELLFQEFGINYNNEPEQFRKGTILYRKNAKSREVAAAHVDIIGSRFWDENPHLLQARPVKPKEKRERKGQPSPAQPAQAGSQFINPDPNAPATEAPTSAPNPASTSPTHRDMATSATIINAPPPAEERVQVESKKYSATNVAVKSTPESPKPVAEENVTPDLDKMTDQEREKYEEEQLMKEVKVMFRSKGEDGRV